MRILITSDIFPPDVGGPATYAVTIARTLAERGHSVQVLTYSLLGQDAADATYPFAVERIPVHVPRWPRLLRAFIRIAVNVQRADLLYINGLLTETALVNVLWRRPAVAKVVGDIAWERARGKKWVADEFEEFQKRRYGWSIELRRALRNWALRRMQAVIAPSVYLGKIIEGWRVDPLRIRVIYNSYETATADLPLATLPLATRYRLITVCRLVEWKGVNEIIEAVAALPDAGLVIVGDGPERVKLESLVQRLRMADRVYFAGRVSREQVISYLRACDLFVLNSRYEGLPHAVLEALTAGLPVVATHVGGTPEVIQDGAHGRLVPVGDPQALQRAVREWIGKRPLGPIVVPEKFTPRRMLHDTVALLERTGWERTK